MLGLNSSSRKAASLFQSSQNGEGKTRENISPGQSEGLAKVSVWHDQKSVDITASAPGQ